MLGMMWRLKEVGYYKSVRQHPNTRFGRTHPRPTPAELGRRSIRRIRGLLNCWIARRERSAEAALVFDVDHALAVETSEAGALPAACALLGDGEAEAPFVLPAFVSSTVIFWQRRARRHGDPQEGRVEVDGGLQAQGVGERCSARSLRISTVRHSRREHSRMTVVSLRPASRG